MDGIRGNWSGGSHSHQSDTDLAIQADRERLKQYERSQDVFAKITLVSLVAIFIVSLPIINLWNGEGSLFAILAITLVPPVSGIISSIALVVLKSKVKEVTNSIGQKTLAQVLELQTKCEEDYEKESATIAMKSRIIIENQVVGVVDGALVVAETQSAYTSRVLKDPEASRSIVHQRISIDDIQCYLKEGDLQYTTSISGGGGGGSSISGAIIGGIIAGDAGAIIGSRNKIDPIKTQTHTHDSRLTLIRYYSDSSVQMLKFQGFELYEFLLKHIPEKDYLAIQTAQAAAQSAAQTQSQSVIDAAEEIKKYKELLDMGAITQEEFDAKKKQLLKL